MSDPRVPDHLQSLWQDQPAAGRLMSGLILFYLGSILAHPESASRGWWLLAGSLVFFVLIGELNRYAAKRIQARIDALERNT